MLLRVGPIKKTFKLSSSSEREARTGDREGKERKEGMNEKEIRKRLKSLS
jgi:hypothetical protein